MNKSDRYCRYYPPNGRTSGNQRLCNAYTGAKIKELSNRKQNVVGEIRSWNRLFTWSFTA